MTMRILRDLILLGHWLLIMFNNIFTSGYAQEWKIPIEYSLGGKAFLPFGNIQLQKKLDGNFSAFFNPFSSFEKISEELSNEARKSAGVAMTYKLKSGDAFSSNSAKAFVDSNFEHLIELAVDQETEKILSISHSPYCQRDSKRSEMPVQVRIVESREINGPDTASYLHRMEEERRARQHGAGQDNRSFIQKYWMYFVPVILFMVLSNAFNTEQQGQE